MNKERLIPLIVATALFMENMDSTVIATSLPAIAADIGTSPLTLKLAITSYLLSLAVFIPASGWTADRFGARMVFSIAVAVFMVGSVGCALSSSVTELVIARILQGAGGAMMTPVGRLVLLRSIDKSALVNAMAWVTVPALVGPVIGPPTPNFTWADAGCASTDAKPSTRPSVMMFFIVSSPGLEARNASRPQCYVKAPCGASAVGRSVD